MRALPRYNLADSILKYLRRLQKQIDSGSSVTSTWKNQRATKNMQKVAETLRHMTGPRERCMYCEDSRGTDIEHFWPKQRFPQKTFLWQNLLWSCAGCNRVKGSQFPLDASGQPLIIDPTAVDPWDFLFYDSVTDELAARWDPVKGEESPIGITTLEVLSTLRYQAVTEGRKRARRNLVRAVRAFLEIERRSPSESNQVELLESVEDNDDYGLTWWFFLREGQEEPPFAELCRDHPDVWAAAVTQIRHRTTAAVAGGLTQEL